MADNADVRWVRPKVASVKLQDADREVMAGNIRYAVRFAKVPKMAVDGADPIHGIERPKVIPGEFVVGPLSVGKLFRETDTTFEADWYWELF